jgi:hypothetical protein
MGSIGMGKSRATYWLKNTSADIDGIDQRHQVNSHIIR